MEIKFYKPKNNTLKKYIEGYYFMSESETKDSVRFISYPGNFFIASICQNANVKFGKGKISISKSKIKKTLAHFYYKKSFPVVVDYSNLFNEITIYFKPLGSVYSTTNVLFIWDRALKDNKFLTQEDKQQIFADSKLNSGESTAYGFGWFLSDDTTYGEIAYHSGYWSGYISQIDRHLDNDITIIILTNNDNRTDKKRMPINEVRKIIYNQSFEKTLRLKDDLLKIYSGVYVDDKGNEANILFAHHALWTNGFELIPISETKFKVDGFRPEVNYTFVLDSNGNVEKIRIEQIQQGVDEVFIRK